MHGQGLWPAWGGSNAGHTGDGSAPGTGTLSSAEAGSFCTAGFPSFGSVAGVRGSMVAQSAEAIPQPASADIRYPDSRVSSPHGFGSCVGLGASGVNAVARDREPALACGARTSRSTSSGCTGTGSAPSSNSGAGAGGDSRGSRTQAYGLPATPAPHPSSAPVSSRSDATATMWTAAAMASKGSNLSSCPTSPFRSWAPVPPLCSKETGGCGDPPPFVQQAAWAPGSARGEPQGASTECSPMRARGIDVANGCPSAFSARGGVCEPAADDRLHDALTRSLQAEARAERAESDLVRSRKALAEAQQRHRDANQLLRRLGDANAQLRLENAALRSGQPSASLAPPSGTSCSSRSPGVGCGSPDDDVDHQCGAAEGGDAARWRARCQELERIFAAVEAERDHLREELIIQRPPPEDGSTSQFDFAAVQSLRHRIWSTERELEEAKRALGASQADVGRWRNRCLQAEAAPPSMARLEPALAAAEVSARSASAEAHQEAAVCSRLRMEFQDVTELKAAHSELAATCEELRAARREADLGRGDGAELRGELETARAAEIAARESEAACKEAAEEVAELQMSLRRAQESREAAEEVAELQMSLRRAQESREAELAQTESQTNAALAAVTEQYEQAEARARRWKAACAGCEEELRTLLTELSEARVAGTALRSKIEDMQKQREHHEMQLEKGQEESNLCWERFRKLEDELKAESGAAEGAADALATAQAVAKQARWQEEAAAQASRAAEYELAQEVAAERAAQGHLRETEQARLVASVERAATMEAELRSAREEREEFSVAEAAAVERAATLEIRLQAAAEHGEKLILEEEKAAVHHAIQAEAAVEAVGRLQAVERGWRLELAGAAAAADAWRSKWEAQNAEFCDQEAELAAARAGKADEAEHCAEGLREAREDADRWQQRFRGLHEEFARLRQAEQEVAIATQQQQQRDPSDGREEALQRVLAEVESLHLQNQGLRGECQALHEHVSDQLATAAFVGESLEMAQRRYGVAESELGLERESSHRRAGEAFVARAAVPSSEEAPAVPVSETSGSTGGSSARGFVGGWEVLAEVTVKPESKAATSGDAARACSASNTRVGANVVVCSPPDTLGPPPSRPVPRRSSLSRSARSDDSNLDGCHVLETTLLARTETAGGDLAAGSDISALGIAGEVGREAFGDAQITKGEEFHSGGSGPCVRGMAPLSDMTNSPLSDVTNGGTAKTRRASRAGLRSGEEDEELQLLLSSNTPSSAAGSCCSPFPQRGPKVTRDREGQTGHFRCMGRGATGAAPAHPAGGAAQRPATSSAGEKLSVSSGSGSGAGSFHLAASPVTSQSSSPPAEFKGRALYPSPRSPGAVRPPVDSGCGAGSGCGNASAGCWTPTPARSLEYSLEEAENFCGGDAGGGLMGFSTTPGGFISPISSAPWKYTSPPQSILR